MIGSFESHAVVGLLYLYRIGRPVRYESGFEGVDIGGSGRDEAEVDGLGEDERCLLEGFARRLRRRLLLEWEA